MALSTHQIIQAADRCVTCGLCLPHCPTYHKTGSEADSPRGRIQLISAVAKNTLPNNARFKEHIDLCLSCRNCESACPNGVQYGRLIDSARAMVNPSTSLGLKSLSWLIAHPGLLNFSHHVLRIAQKIRVLRPLSLLHPTLKKAVNLLPTWSPAQTWKAHYPSQHKQGDVSLFIGCINSAFDADTLRATIYILTKLGYDVHIPKTQVCCGGLARQQGDIKKSDALIIKNTEAFNPAYPVLTVVSGCGAGLQDYTRLNIQDISDFLLTCDWTNVKLEPLNKTIAVHDPCTLRNVLKTHASVYKLLEKIPNATITALKGNTQCCGGAGAYAINQPEMATRLLADKMQYLTDNHYSILATSNIGCAMQLGSGIRERAMAIEVLHPVGIIAKQMGFHGKLD